MMNEFDLFVSTASDLREKLAAGDEYNLLRAAGLLRQLLLDSTPLVHTVNRKYRFKLNFRITPMPDYPAFMRHAWIFHDLFGYEIPANRPCWRSVKFDEFLSSDCLSYGGTRFTARQAVLYCAHVRGGVHFDSTPDAIAQLMTTLDTDLQADGLGACIRSIIGIANATLAGIETIEQAILSDQNAAGGI